VADGEKDVGGSAGLEQVSRCSGAKGFGRQSGIVIHRQIHQPGARQRRMDLPAGIKAVEERHVGVDQDDIRLEGESAANEGSTIADDGGDFELGFE
jgi:hypothetical protein